MNRIRTLLAPWLMAVMAACFAPTAWSATAIFAGGCFWCMEPPYDKLDGVAETVSGYIGGDLADPSYEAVSSGGTGHAEAVRITYDPDKIGYRQLLEVFWANVDPLDGGGQFCDRGSQYRSEIFYLTDDQRRLALASREAVQDSLNAKVQTGVSAAGEFYPAEDYHQNYYEKNPLTYKYYRFRCGRDQRLEELWGDAEALDLFEDR